MAIVEILHLVGLWLGGGKVFWARLKRGGL